MLEIKRNNDSTLAILKPSERDLEILNNAFLCIAYATTLKAKSNDSYFFYSDYNPFLYGTLDLSQSNVITFSEERFFTWTLHFTKEDRGKAISSLILLLFGKLIIGLDSVDINNIFKHGHVNMFFCEGTNTYDISNQLRCFLENLENKPSGLVLLLHGKKESLTNLSNFLDTSSDFLIEYYNAGSIIVQGALDMLRDNIMLSVFYLT